MGGGGGRGRSKWGASVEGAREEGASAQGAREEGASAEGAREERARRVMRRRRSMGGEVGK